MTSRREENSIGSRPVRQITAQLAGISQVGGSFEVRGVEIYAFWNNMVITEIEEGKEFKLVLECEVRNLDAGATWWSTSVTAWDTTHNLRVNSVNYGEHLGSDWMHLMLTPVPPPTTGINSRIGGDLGGVFRPAEDTSYRLKLFVNQIAHAGNPPETEW